MRVLSDMDDARRPRLAAAALAVALAGCAPPPALTPTAPPALISKIQTACAGSEYRNCVRDTLEYIRGFPAGTVIVICDHGGGSGNVTNALRVEDAADACSEGGAFQGVKVVAAFALP